MTTNASFGLCANSDQYEQVYRLIKNIKMVMSSYEPPCVEMKIPVDVNQQVEGFASLLKLYISYTTEDFQEIVNVKDFDVETLWSSVGGFIGIFLGYSLLQFPEILDYVWSISWDKFALISWIEYLLALIVPGCRRKRKFAILRLMKNIILGYIYFILTTN